MLEPIKPEDITPGKAKDQRLFVVVPFRAIKDKGLTIQRMRALMTICSYANHKGNAWPSIERMAEDMGISKPTMSNHIKYLTDRGYLKTINNSYTVGKHAKPRAIVYDPNNPPNDDDWQTAIQDHQESIAVKEAIAEQRDKLVSTNQPTNEVLAKPASLYRVWNDEMRARYGLDHPYLIDIYGKLATRYSLEDFKKATRVYLATRSSPPVSVSVMLRS